MTGRAAVRATAVAGLGVAMRTTRRTPVRGAAGTAAAETEAVSGSAEADSGIAEEVTGEASVPKSD